MAVKTLTIDAIAALGWTYSHPEVHGGWIHHDVRDNDGDLIVFGSAEDVARYLGLDQCEECGV